MRDVTKAPHAARDCRVHLEHVLGPGTAPRSTRLLQTAAMFGIDPDGAFAGRVVPPADVPLPAGGIVFITGPSGGGKSTILRLLAGAAEAEGRRVLRVDHLPAMPERALVDLFDDAPLEETMSRLARAGLADASCMLRTPGELSDGQRDRLRLAQMMHSLRGDAPGCIILADEFTATLDRTTATLLARHVRRWMDRDGAAHTFVAATAHDDLLDALDPDVLVWKGLSEEMEIVAR